MAKVSVIIPVYNVENYIRQCLDSVINQTLKDIEIICIDDGSTDDSGVILDEYASKDSRIKVIHNSNQGAGPSRNLGIQMSCGKYLSILDSDDIFDLKMLELLFNKAELTNADITICRCQVLNMKNLACKVFKQALKYIPNKDTFNYKESILA